MRLPATGAILACLVVIGCGSSHRVTDPLALFIDHERKAGHDVHAAGCQDAHTLRLGEISTKWLCWTSPTHVTLATLSKDGRSVSFHPSNVKLRMGIAKTQELPAP